MKKLISATIYYVMAAILLVDGVLVKYFFNDTDMGARFKGFNHQLLVSDIIFMVALFLAVIGFIFHVLRKNNKSTLKDSTVTVSALLIIPMTLILALTPVLETIYPGKVGDGMLSSALNWYISIATFAAMAWVVVLPVNIIKQSIVILTGKTKKPQPATVIKDTQSAGVKQFKIKENGFKEIRKQILIRTIPLTIVSGTVGLLIFEFAAPNHANSEVSVLPFLIPLLLCAFALGTINVINRQKAIYKSYELTIDDSSITRKQANTPTVQLLFSEISRMTRYKQGGLVIKGNHSTRLIIIPAQLEGLDELVNILQANCSLPISNSKPLLERLTIPLVFVVLGLMAATYLSTNKILVTVSGTLLIALMIYSFIVIQTNKNIDSKTRRSSYWTIIVVLSLIGMIVSKLMS